ncbi:glycosyltransferase family 2 protein [Cohnella sp. REN36]|uniref:glycosyltransferase family 2 protein n=1 Tax=Cohnella sp. REN36 TaxID=2887347 RepID=UPI001D137B04|nr:glycosyltransferase family 2 protein [Cohnella sp. REN36]MCC3374099.1 glycosyltransferase family 2 protein [Cohnella sp. REN36]
MTNAKTLVLIPAYNEERNISSVIKGIQEETSEIDILVVDDCSKDNTAKVVRSHSVNMISLGANLGYSGAIITGFKYALDHNYKYVIQFDGDGQHDPKTIKELIHFIKESNCDIVIGSRFLQKTAYKHGSFRSLGTKLFSLIIKLSTGKTITDPTSGLQILNQQAYSYYVSSDNYPEYPDANIIILMLRNGYAIKEMPVTMHSRLSGVGMHA